MNAFVKSLVDKQGYDVLAHPEETLEEHIERCCKYYRRINSEKNLEEIIMRYVQQKLGESERERETKEFIYQAFLDVLDFHDVGKLTHEFQRIKMRNPDAPEETLVDESARHSLISAAIYLDYEFGLINELKVDRAKKKGLRRIVTLNAYIISRHHGRLKPFRDFSDELKNGYVIEVLRNNGLNGYRIKNIENKYLGDNPGYNAHVR